MQEAFIKLCKFILQTCRPETFTLAVCPAPPDMLDVIPYIGDNISAFYYSSLIRLPTWSTPSLLY